MPRTNSAELDAVMSNDEGGRWPPRQHLGRRCRLVRSSPAPVVGWYNAPWNSRRCWLLSLVASARHRSVPVLAVVIYTLPTRHLANRHRWHGSATTRRRRKTGKKGISRSSTQLSSLSCTAATPTTNQPKVWCKVSSPVISGRLRKKAGVCAVCVVDCRTSLNCNQMVLKIDCATHPFLSCPVCVYTTRFKSSFINYAVDHYVWSRLIMKCLNERVDVLSCTIYIREYFVILRFHVYFAIQP